MNEAFTLRIRETIDKALTEDIGTGDITTDAIVTPTAIGSAKILAKEKGIVAGLEVARLIYSKASGKVQFQKNVEDGTEVLPFHVLATVSGPLRELLSTERVVLNFLQRMSGIATITRLFVEAVCGTDAIILDTRKTVPGLRLFDKWGVRIGGGQNHREGLYDMVLIKENHVTAARGIAEAVRRARQGSKRRMLLELEVQSLEQVRQAIELDVDRILLDNMTTDEMSEAVKFAAGRVPLEASGNVTLANVASIAATGVNFISVGMLTHSVRALDISFLLNSVSENL